MKKRHKSWFLLLSSLLLAIGAGSVWALDCPPGSAQNSVMSPAMNPEAVATVAPLFQRLHYDFTEKKTPEGCPSPWRCEPIEFNARVKTLGIPHEVSAQLRSGYLPENPAVPFRGNVIFYEGLGDSMLNHAPLFKKLTDAGYRVIAFDYMGQGGSTGTMDNTRIEDIPRIGALAWSKYARDTNAFPAKTVIGWSTGGLAAYYQAHLGQLDKVVLIAPGISARWDIGESHLRPLEVDEITLPTLTTETYRDGTSNPHVDPIRPDTPLVVPDFAIDLQEKGLWARNRWAIPPSVQGLTLLSGPHDTYVNAQQTEVVLAARAPGFKIVRFGGALHEIDNEVPPIAQAAQGDILSFIESPSSGSSSSSALAAH